ncbi:hypothetical protein [Vibrio alginolyticus]|uniref:hypothetical protein n=1 Tax=Vibrio alginolyticus TaxID=663 RepID=UPI0006CA7E9F|nr:hypothetical protein [Vibrio alginolyticus]KPM95053.1 hypothetical protein AOG25_26555 [Vibrio alginolyticus]
MKKLVLQKASITEMESGHISASLSACDMIRDNGLLVSMVEVDSNGTPVTMMQLFDNEEALNCDLCKGQSYVYISDTSYELLSLSSNKQQKCLALRKNE